MKSLTLKNYFFLADPNDQSIESLQEWLAKQMLHGKISRARTRFIKLIIPQVKELEEERLKLLQEYAEKRKEKDKDVIVYFDKNDKKTTDANEGVKYVMKDMDRFVKEYGELVNEEFVIDVTPANQETIYGVRDLILNTESAFVGRMAMRYDEWCSCFEDIKEQKLDK